MPLSAVLRTIALKVISVILQKVACRLQKKQKKHDARGRRVKVLLFLPKKIYSRLLRTLVNKALCCVAIMQSLNVPEHRNAASVAEIPFAGGQLRQGLAASTGSGQIFSLGWTFLFMSGLKPEWPRGFPCSVTMENASVAGSQTKDTSVSASCHMPGKITTTLRAVCVRQTAALSGDVPQQSYSCFTCVSRGDLNVACMFLLLAVVQSFLVYRHPNFCILHASLLFSSLMSAQWLHILCLQLHCLLQRLSGQTAKGRDNTPSLKAHINFYHFNVMM